MTYEEARIILLEGALRQAQHTCRFLHDCLVQLPPATWTDSNIPSGGSKYSYPEQTLCRLDEWERLAPLPSACYHSMTKENCPSCQDRVRRNRLEHEAKRVVAAAAVSKALS